jgi:CubicO group peptidase (beta-lactamase class C family)
LICLLAPTDFPQPLLVFLLSLCARLRVWRLAPIRWTQSLGERFNSHSPASFVNLLRLLYLARDGPPIIANLELRGVPLGLPSLALFTAGYAQTLDKAKLDQFFDRLAEKNKAMGSLTIAKDGNVLYTRAIGYSQINGTEKKPLTIATRYRVGSITKMFTGVMILQLVEEGKLKLTDTLDKFFPQIPNASKITIAQILARRSGIHDVSEDRDFRILCPSM